MIIAVKINMPIKNNTKGLEAFRVTSGSDIKCNLSLKFIKKK